MGEGIVGREWTVRHTAGDFELLSSFAEVCVYVCICIYTYLGLVQVSHPGAGKKICTVVF